MRELRIEGSFVTRVTPFNGARDSGLDRNHGARITAAVEFV
jgi:hypothetical protein